MFVPLLFVILSAAAAGSMPEEHVRIKGIIQRVEEPSVEIFLLKWKRGAFFPKDVLEHGIARVDREGTANFLVEGSYLSGMRSRFILVFKFESGSCRSIDIESGNTALTVSSPAAPYLSNFDCSRLPEIAEK